MKKIGNDVVFLALLWLVPMVLPAQSKAVDSLLQLLKIAKEDTNKVTILNDLSERLWRTANSLQGLKYAEDALLLAKKLNFESGIANAYYFIGSHYEYQGNYPEALKNHYAALKMAEIIRDQILVADSYLSVGADYEEQGRSHPDTLLREQLFERALFNDFASLKGYSEINHKRGVANCYISIGVVYMDRADYSRALQNFFAGLKIAEQTGEKRFITILNGNIGDVYTKMGKYNNALSNLFTSIKVGNEIGDKKDVSDAYISIGTIYAKSGEVSKARQSLCHGLSLAKEIGNKEAIVPGYKALAMLDSTERNWEAAYEDQKLFMLYRDSLTNEGNSKKIIQVQMQYEFDLKEHSLKNQQLLTETKLQSQKKQKYLYLTGALLLALLCFFVFLNFRNQLKLNRLNSASHAKEKTELELHSLRAQLNPHFMFNSLNAIQELILKEDFDNSHTYLARFAKLVRMLLDNAEKPLVTLSNEINFLELYLSLEKLRIPDLHFSISVAPAINTGETVLPNMVIQPFIENALWHGLSQKSGDKYLDLIIEKQNGAVVYHIKDNGVGRKKAAEFKSLYRKEHKSKGMELLTKRFKLLNEEFGSKIKTEVSDVTNNEQVEGTLVSIHVPDSFSENAKAALQ